MPQRNVKDLGPPVRAQNTLNRPPRGTTLSERPNKRQKLDSSSPATGRLFDAFSPPKPTRSKYFETTKDGKDVYEIDSTTTEGASGRQNIQATQHEFRNAQIPMGTKKRGRVRRSRQQLTSVGGSSPSSAAHLPERTPSPDPLADDDNSPVGVTSDITSARGGAKRSRQPSNSEPHVKRSRPASTRRESIDDHPDELSLSINRPRPENPVSQLVSTVSERRGGLRGDIRPTHFTSPKSRKQSHPGDNTMIPVKRAVSGSMVIKSTSAKQYSLIPSHGSDGKVNGIRLVLGKTGENEVAASGTLQSEAEQEIATCMSFDFRNLEAKRGVEQQMTNSEFMLVKRRLSPGQPPKLVFEFPSIHHCTKLLELIPPHFTAEVHKDKLEQTFNHMWEVALERQEQLKTTKMCSEHSKSMAGPGHQQIVVEIPSRRESIPDEPPRKTKLKDQMQGSSEGKEEPRVVSDIQPTISANRRAVRSSSPRMRTRRSTATYEKPPGDAEFSSFALKPQVIGWTTENPDWKARWQKSLTYPATGRHRTTVDADDIPRLNEDECLNDNIINFYLKWLKVNLERARPEILQKVHVFESYFFERLKTSKYQGVRSWTSKIDLLSYDYIVVPVNEHFHWYLAIICNVAKALPGSKQATNEHETINNGKAEHDDSSKISVVEERVKAISIDDNSENVPSTTKNNVEDAYKVESTPPPEDKSKSKKKSTGPSSQKFDPKSPRIVTLDSLGGARSPACKILREYLAEEALDKKGVRLEAPVPGMTAKGIPIQNNGSDCGLYILAFIEKFLGDPDTVARQLLQKESLDWSVDASTMRDDIRTMLFKLQEEQQEREASELAEKKAKRRRSKSIANAGTQSSPGPMEHPSASQEADRIAASKAFASSPSGGRSGADAVDKADEDATSSVIVQIRNEGARDGSNLDDTDKARFLSPLPNSDGEGHHSGEQYKVENTFRMAPNTPETNNDPQCSASAKTSARVRSSPPSLVQEILSSDSEPEANGEQKTVHNADLVKRKEQQLHPSIESDHEKSDGPSVQNGKEKKQDEEKTPPRSGRSFFGRWFGSQEATCDRATENKKRASYDGIDKS